MSFSLLPPFLILFEFSVHSASVYLAKMSSEESSDSEMPYDDEVWEKEEVSRDDDSDGGNFSSNLTGTWPSHSVSTLFTLVSQ